MSFCLVLVGMNATNWYAFSINTLYPCISSTFRSLTS